MFELIVFVSEVILSVVVSYGVIRSLKLLLRNLLVEVCGTGQRADFWAMFCELVIYFTPLLMVISVTTNAPGSVDAVLAIRGALFRVLLGQLLALAAIGCVIWRAIKLPDNKLTTTVTTSSNL